MIKKEVKTVPLEVYDEIPYCRRCCIQWSECQGKQVTSCHFIKTILRIQEQRNKFIFTLGGKPVTTKRK